MTKNKKEYVKKTEEEKQLEVERLLSALEEGVKNFKYDPEVYKAILSMQALMPQYSFRNIMIARAQNPQARFIASFKRWKQLNRSVQKGERAIRILAPRFKKELNSTNGEYEKKLIGYLTVPVFDISQTEGDPLPIDRIKLALEGESEEAKQILEWVIALAAADDCPVTMKDTGSAKGYYRPADHSIAISNKISVNHQAKTGVHELVHSRVHRFDHGSTAEERECVAEGAAYVVCSYFGFDTSSYSFGYVKSWSKDGGESLMKFGVEIQRVAASVITEMEELEEQAKFAPAASDAPVQEIA